MRRRWSRAWILGGLALALSGCDDSGGGAEGPEPDGGRADGAAVDVGPGRDGGGDAARDVDRGPPSDGAVDAGADGAVTEDAEPPGDLGPLRRCETARRPLAPGLIELSHDDGVAAASVAGQPWEVAGVRIAETALHEAVGFELEHPARIHGFSIQYGAVPAGGDTPLQAGLYGDFGYNGFDFWAKTPWWTGTRCAEDVREGAWLTFALETPIEVAHPGLVYVAHLRNGAEGAAWAFDATPPNDECEGGACCEPWGACRSAWNLPELRSPVINGQQHSFWNGLSLTFQYDYLVRLHVEYTVEQPAEDKVFQPIADVSPGSRQAFGDYDGDGRDDLLTDGPRLLRNTPEGWVDVTEAAGLTTPGVRGSGVFGDFDNDGCLDIFFFSDGYAQPDRLLRNDCEGRYVDVSAFAGIEDRQSVNDCNGKAQGEAPTAAAAWFDLDGDGFLDLYLANFICWDDFTFFVDTVWHNQGDGTFVELTGEAGFPGHESVARSSRGVSPIDMDQDGHVDVLVNRYTLHANAFFHNQGDGTVVERAAALGLAGKRTRRGITDYHGHSIGAAWGDLNGDGHFDLVVANLAHPRFFDFSDKTNVLINDGSGRFVDTQGDFSEPFGAAGLRFQETHSVPVLADFDHDGHLDLAISAVYDGRPSDFYWGNGDGTFRLDAYGSGVEVRNGWGMAVADVDLDGAMDLAARGVLYRNTGARGRWLQVRVVGDVRSNRAGIGATVRVEAGERAWVRHVNGGTGQGGQDSLVVHFGLGEAARVDRVVVRFIGGGEVVYEGPFEPDQRLWLYESGDVRPGWRNDP